MRWPLCVVAIAACSSPRATLPPSPPPAEVAATPTPTPPGPAPQIELAFAGDVMFGRYIDKGFRPIPADEHDVFAAVEPLLDSDFTMVNLETPILRDPPAQSPYGTRMRFVATPARVKSLLAAHIDGVTVANNHAYDMHHRGVVETPQVLDELGLHYIGARRAEDPVFRAESFDIAGWHVAFIAAATVWNGKDPPARLPDIDPRRLKQTLVPVIESARHDHDLVIVVLHWGTEYADAPDKWQVKAAHAFIDAGADAVIGSHPHVVQGIERYKGGVIAYSLGNFLFDNAYQNRGWHGILRLTFRPGCLVGARYFPTVSKRPYYAPIPARGTHFSDVAGRLRKLSRARGTAWTLDGDHLEVAGGCE